MSGRPIAGSTRLQKLVFLVQQRLVGVSESRDLRVDFAFRPNRFGPADTYLYPDLEFLVALEYVLRRPADDNSSPTREPELEEMTERELSFAYLMGSEDRAVDLAAAENIEEEFLITDRGRKFLTQLEVQLDTRDLALFRSLRSTAEEIRRKYGDWPLDRLLRYVYTEYPEYTTASEIRRRVLGHA